MESSHPAQYLASEHKAVIYLDEKNRTLKSINQTKAILDLLTRKGGCTSKSSSLCLLLTLLYCHLLSFFSAS